MLIYGKTDIGMVRNENQDSYDIRAALPSGHTVGVVCDGMGGPAGGKQASGIAVKAYMDFLETRLEPGMDIPDLRRLSREAVSEANRAVWDAAQNMGYPSMGTTLVSAIVCASGVMISNVGDSRAYYLYGNQIFRVTRDHSLVQNMIERGELTEEEARVHPKRNLITRALGPDETGKAAGEGFPLPQPAKVPEMEPDGYFQALRHRGAGPAVEQAPLLRPSHL